jgi:hypothetical protein
LFTLLVLCITFCFLRFGSVGSAYEVLVVVVVVLLLLGG